MKHRRPLLSTALAGAVLLACTGCPAPADVHPLGAACTWPAAVDLQRDGLALLHHDGPNLDAEVTLLDVAAGTVRARCTGLSDALIGAEFIEPGYHEQQLSLLPMLSPDLRFGVTPTGVIEMATGRLVPNPDPRWPAVALPGESIVLRRDTGVTEGPDVPGRYCLAAAPDTPQTECRPLAGSGPGVPVVHDDGSVGWAPGVPVAIELTGPDGRVATGVMQTDGIGIVGVRMSPSGSLFGGELRPPLSRRSGLLSRSEMGSAPALSGLRAQPVWYTLDPATGTGALHVAPVPTNDIKLRVGRQAVLRSATVIDDGAAVLLVLDQPDYTTPGEPEIHIVRVGEDGSVTVQAQLRRAHSEADLADPAGYDVRGTPGVLAWPDRVPVATL